MKKHLILFFLLATSLGFAADPPVINNPTNYNICDEDFNGFGIFDLQMKNAEILGALSPTDHTVSYHETMADASNGVNALPNLYMNIVNPQTIYVRVAENTTGEFSLTELLLIVNAQPNLPSPIPSLNMYETPSDGIAVFDLVSHTSVILNGGSPPVTVLWFYTSQTDAIANINVIPNANAYNGTDQQVIWVRAEHVWTGCYTVSSFVLRVVDSANLIVFTDANFKAKLLSSSPSNPVGMYNSVGVTIDANGDGEIQFSEATAINSLYVNNSNIGDLFGINYFTNLQILECNQNHIASLDVSGTPMLFLSCAENALTSLTVNNFSNLAAIDCHQNHLTSLDLSGLNGLYTLNCHSNQLTALDTSGLLSLNALDCSNNALANLSVSNLSALEKLNCGNNTGMTSLTLSNLPALEELYVFSTNLGNLNVTAFPTLTYLDCGGAHLSTLNVNGLNNLAFLSCAGNQLNTLNVSTNTNLQHLNCAINQLSTLDLSANNNLTKLYCWQNNIPELNVSNLTLLEDMDCQDNNMTTLTFGANAVLEQVNCGYNDLTAINVSTLPALRNLVSWNNQLTALDVSQNTALQYISCNDNLFTTLDFSANINLVTLSVFDNPNLETLFVKNGRDELNADSLLNCPNLEYVCADDFQVASIMAGNPLVTVNSFCSFVPGGSYNTLTGTALFDINNDGCGDGSDIPFPFLNLGVDIDGVTTNSTVFTNNAGVYNLYTSFPGSYQLNPIIENPGYFNIAPISANFPVIDNSTVTQNICITANGVHPDLEVVLTPITPARPGFDATYKIVYKNKGNQVLSGAVTLAYDDSVLDFVLASAAPASTAAGSITWNYGTLLPFENRSIDLTMNVNSPVETPPVNIGNLLAYTVSITPVSGDEIPADNTFTLNQTVVGSYDPNDITCLEGATLSPSEIGKYLHYIINFENTGNFYAENVVVQDIIDTDKYDITSLQVLNASHNMAARVTGNKAEFVFEGINLAAVGGNPPVGGHGNVLFKIRSKSSLVANDFVNKAAKIYFDYNAPITTNDALTTFALLSNQVVVADNSIVVFPNPSGGTFNIKSDTNVESYELYDVQGRLLEKSIEGSTTVRLDISGRESGIYFLKITSGKGSKIEKVVKK